VWPQKGQWISVESKNELTPREECSMSAAGNHFFLIGGRGKVPIEGYNPQTKTWAPFATPPLEMHHMQALEYHGIILIIGAFTGNWPNETPIPNIYFYDPLQNKWLQGPLIPTKRLRGSTGLALYKNKVYMALGIVDGHTKGWVPWLDSFDPLTGNWEILPDAPRARDHFQTAIYQGKLYALGGRRSGWEVLNPGENVFTSLEKTDVYDIEKKSWITLPSPSGDMPHPRSGGVVAVMGNDVVYAGGGNLSNGDLAHSKTHALNTQSLNWRELANMITGRQVTGGVLNNSGLYIASGSGGAGGSPQLKTTEAFYLGEVTQPNLPLLSPGSLKESVPLKIQANLNETKTGALKLAHSGGLQAVLVESISLSQAGKSFQISPDLNFPLLVAPEQNLNIPVQYTHTGIPATATLQVKLAVPSGAVLNFEISGDVSTPVYKKTKFRQTREPQILKVQPSIQIHLDTQPFLIDGKKPTDIKAR